MDKPNSPAYAQLNGFCDIFDFANMTDEKTCFTKNHSSGIDLILKNKGSSFQLSNATEAGLSGCHKVIATCIKPTISRLKSKVIYYRNYKKLQHFSNDAFQSYYDLFQVN